MRIKYAVIYRQQYYALQLSNGMPVGEFIVDLSVLTDGIIPASGDNLLVVAEEIRRGDKGDIKMTRITNLVWKLRIWNDTRGQDLIEYALMAGFVAVAAGAIMPGVATSISTIFSKIASTMTAAAATS